MDITPIMVIPNRDLLRDQHWVLIDRSMVPGTSVCTIGVPNVDTKVVAVMTKSYAE